MRKPNFFIIGAPKCGTTSLAAWLAEHPQIYVTSLKEPHYFNKDGLTSTDTLEEYESLFSGATADHLAVGEASTHYLYSSEAVPRILDYNPAAQLIVCLRNPLEMAPSLHSERLKGGRETVKRFADAWRLQAARSAGKYIPRGARRDPKRLQYGEYCKLGEQLTRLYVRAPRDQVLTLLLDDIRDNPNKEYQKVLAFLGVPYDNRERFPVHNRRSMSRSLLLARALRGVSTLKRSMHLGGVSIGIGGAIRKLNTTHEPDPLDSELIAELKEYFRADIGLLESVLQRDLSHWLKWPGTEGQGAQRKAARGTWG